MKTTKKILCVLLAIFMLAGAMVMIVSCGDNKTPDGGGCVHKDENKDGKCDICGQPSGVEPKKCENCVDSDGDGACDVCGSCLECVDIDGDNVCEFCGELVKQPVEVTFSVVTEDKENIKSALSGQEIKLTIKLDGKDKFSGSLDENGKITATLVPASYLVEISGLPDGWYCQGSGAKYTISSEKNSYELIAVDNNPNGSEEKPYYIGSAPVEAEFDAGETLNYSTKGSKKYLIITNPNAKVTYNGIDYLPDENGFIRVAISPKINNGQLDTNTYTPFTITNTSDVSNTIIAEFETQPGSSEDPFIAELSVPTQITASSDNTVFYKWTAVSKGYLALESTSANGYIMMHNITSCEVTSFVEGQGKLYIRVSAGDIVMISVSANIASETDVSFELNAYGATEQSPMEIDSTASFRLGKSTSEAVKNSVYLKYTGESKEIKINADGVSITVNGESVTGVNTEDGMVYTFSAEEGDVIVLTCDELISSDATNSVGVSVII